MTKFKPVSVTKLASLNMPDACPRCFWIDVNIGKPYIVFPRVFNQLDKLQKRVGRILIDRLNEPDLTAYPEYQSWTVQVGDIVGYFPSVTWRKFSAEIGTNTGELTIRGEPDEMVRLADGDMAIIDYKTSQSYASDTLGDRYIAQLNAYEAIAAANEYPTVSKMALVYWSPDTDMSDQVIVDNLMPQTIALNMNAIVKDVPIKPGLVGALVNKAISILSNGKPPAAHAKCRNCAKLEKIVAAL